MHQAVSVSRFYLGILGMGPVSLLFMVVNTTLSTRVPERQQVAASSLVQLSGQLGRGFGPIAASAWYAYFTKLEGTQAGLSAAALFELFFLVLGLLPPFSGFTTFFGSWSDKSPAQVQREAEEGGGKGTIV